MDAVADGCAFQVGTKAGRDADPGTDRPPGAGEAFDVGNVAEPRRIFRGSVATAGHAAGVAEFDLVDEDGGADAERAVASDAHRRRGILV